MKEWRGSFVGMLMGETSEGKKNKAKGRRAREKGEKAGARSFQVLVFRPRGKEKKDKKNKTADTEYGVP